ncbi:pancreatic progenitor cell differentiation and proliferation factor-like protein isoform X3 [Narcine bancroftii]|uniref:pancreatic progenitor cell differentiation and proliferation factor-like protein isoform X3 n=1 Tax=Narcine bancroftii TaxID=1343680 RepID=UPI003832131E
MASVPSAGCLLAARNPYCRSQLNSSTGVGSGGSCSLENPMEHEKPHQGFLLTLEKCWWLKNFLNSETPPHPINEELSSKSLKWQQKLRKIEFKYRTKLHSPTLEETRPTCPDRTTESRLEFS